MLTLGLSTSSGQFALVLGKNSKILFNSDDLQLSNNKDISVLISKGIELTGISVNDISNIIVDIGPGGTSRVRTGISFANSLAFSLGISVCPVSSLELAGRDAWEIFRLPVVSTVNSINGNAYIGLFNGEELITIEYGVVEDILPRLVIDIDAFVTVGYHRENIKNLIPNKKVFDSGLLFGNAKILVEKDFLFLGRALSFPYFAIPITEKIL